MIESEINAQQAEHWAGEGGEHWARTAEGHDRMLAPFAKQLMAAAKLGEGENVIDIGCGCGATTVAAATAVGRAGTALGVDLSPQMLGVARSRAELAGVQDRTRFEVADAQVTDLGAKSRDIVMSRFGVMFFSDPVAAFSNVATALRRGGCIAICVWQQFEVNEWMVVPGKAAAEHVGGPERAAPDAPGPFSLGDPSRIRTILGEAGFNDVAIEPFETTVLLAGGGSLDSTMAYLLDSGFGRAMLADAPEPNRTNAIAAVRSALEPSHDGDGVRLKAATWIVTART